MDYKFWAKLTASFDFTHTKVINISRTACTVNSDLCRVWQQLFYAVASTTVKARCLQ